MVDGRSTTSGAGTPPVGCRLLALTSRGGSDPSMAMCCKMAVLRPRIISGGLMSSFLAHVRASHGCGADPANDVTAASKCIKVRPIAIHTMPEQLESAKW